MRKIAILLIVVVIAASVCPDIQGYEITGEMCAALSAAEVFGEWAEYITDVRLQADAGTLSKDGFYTEEFYDYVTGDGPIPLLSGISKEKVTTVFEETNEGKICVYYAAGGNSQDRNNSLYYLCYYYDSELGESALCKAKELCRTGMESSVTGICGNRYIYSYAVQNGEDKGRIYFWEQDGEVLSLCDRFSIKADDFELCGVKLMSFTELIENYSNRVEELLEKYGMSEEEYELFNLPVGETEIFESLKELAEASIKYKNGGPDYANLPPYSDIYYDYFRKFDGIYLPTGFNDGLASDFQPQKERGVMQCCYQSYIERTTYLFEFFWDGEKGAEALTYAEANSDEAVTGDREIYSYPKQNYAYLTRIYVWEQDGNVFRLTDLRNAKPDDFDKCSVKYHSFAELISEYSEGAEVIISMQTEAKCMNTESCKVI